MNEEIYEGTPAKEDVLIGTDSGYNRYRRPDSSTYVHYPYSQMATVTAYSAKDGKGQPIRTADGKLITGNTQAEADGNRFRYDMNHWAEANRRKTAHLPEGWRERIVTPDMNTFNAITAGGLNLLSPTWWGRFAYNTVTGANPGLTGNNGLVPDWFAEKHPYWTLAINGSTDALTGVGLAGDIPKAVNFLQQATARYSPIFIKTANSFTRGVGRGIDGITDIVKTGVVRGNPRGSEVSAKEFAKRWRKNRYRTREIFLDTGIPNIENKYFSRMLSEEEFNAIKASAKKFPYKDPFKKINNSKISLITRSSDPLEDYATYADYIDDINRMVSEVESMSGKIARGEIPVDTKLTESMDNGFKIGAPIQKRFGVNSDYVSDGHPLTYWYPDGRDPLKGGYDYAGSDWGVRVLNADKHEPFMHSYHLHPSFFKTPRLLDPDVQIFRKGPLGLTVRVPKSKLLKQFGNSTNIIIPSAPKLNLNISTAPFKVSTFNTGVKALNRNNENKRKLIKNIQNE